jgi:Rieske Fe-S protein
MTAQTTPTDQTTPLEPAPLPAGLTRASSSRRRLFKTAGLVALVGAGGSTLAACSSGGSATPATSAAPSSAPAPSSPASSGSAAGGSTVTTAEVPVGGGFIMPNADFVVTQPTKGSYKAFSKICTHQGCPVSQIADKEIICRCHGSHFSIADGSVVSGPAQSPLPAATTKVSGTTITVSA